MSKYLAALKAHDFHEPSERALQKLQEDHFAVNAVPELKACGNTDEAKLAANAGLCRTATTAEAAELRALIKLVIPTAPHEWDWVHQIACADPDDALTCFRALAADRGLTTPSEGRNGD